MKEISLLDKSIVATIGVTLLLLAFVVFYRNRKAGTNKAFVLFAISVDIWIISAFLSELKGFTNVRLLLSKLAYAGATATIVLIYNLVFVFSAGWLRSSYFRFLRKIILVLAIVLIPLLLFTNLIVNGVKPQPWGFDITNGPLYSSIPIFMLACMCLLFISFAVSYRSSTGRLKKQLQYLLIGLFTFVAISVFINVVVRAIVGTDEYYRLGNYSVIFVVAFTAYAIMKHRLMDIRLLVLKSVAYSLSLATVVAGYVLFAVLIFQRLNSFINPIVLNVITLFALVFTFQPLRRYIEQHTDRVFAKGRYNFNELLGSIGEITKKNSRSITGLTNKVMETLTKKMRINGAAFVLLNSPVPTQIRTIGFKSRNKHLWNKPARLATDQSKTIVYDELPEDSNDREILRKVGAEVLIPIKTEQETEAVLALGPKNSGDMYTAQDLNLLELVAPQIAIALENAKSFKEKEQRIAELHSINKMFQHIEHFLDLDNLMQKIVDEVIMVTGAEGGSVMLLDKSGKNLTIKTARNLHPLISLNTKIKVGEGIAGTVAKTHKPLILNGLRDKRFKPHLKREDVVSAISVPMKAGDKLIGVLNVNRKKLRIEFSEENVNVMTAFAAQAAEAIVKAGYYHQIEKLSIKNDNQFKEFTKALAKTVDAKDPYTYGHSEAVTNYALEIAKEMGVSQSQMRILEIGGRLHDIGKIGVAEHILNKPAGLTDEEYKQIQRHPEIGARILQNTSSLKSIRDLILYHHERFDGRGYPTNLRGKEIPLLARILAVADTFDAMTSHRAYRKALSRKMAVDEIMKCSGSQFDPDIVKAFLRVLDKKRFRVIKNTMHQEAFVAKVQGLNLKPTAD